MRRVKRMPSYRTNVIGELEFIAGAKEDGSPNTLTLWLFPHPATDWSTTKALLAAGGLKLVDARTGEDVP